MRISISIIITLFYGFTIISQNILVEAEILKTGIPMVRGFIIKNLPASFWTSEELQKPFWNAFAEIGLNSRNFLLNHLGSANESIMTYLSSNLNVMSKNQLKKFLHQLGELRSIDKITEKNLFEFAKSDSETYWYLVGQFLEDI